MKKAKNILVTLILIIIAVCLIVYIFLKSRGYFMNSYNDTKNQIKDMLNIDTEVIIPQVEEPKYLSEDDFSIEVFEEYNSNYHAVADNTSDEASSIIKEKIDNLKKLYERDKLVKQYDNIKVPLAIDSSKEWFGEYRITQCFITHDVEDIEIPKDCLKGLDVDPRVCKEDGSIKNGVAYCVIDIEITNTEKNNISLYHTYGNSLQMMFLDDTGEIYWDSSIDYVSFQPGENLKELYYYYDFKADETLKIRYVFSVPVEAFKYYECCLVIEEWGYITKPLDTSRLVVMTELNEQMKSGK